MSAKDAVKAREDAKLRPVREPEPKKPKAKKTEPDRPIETDLDRIKWEVPLGDG